MSCPNLNGTFSCVKFNSPNTVYLDSKGATCCWLEYGFKRKPPHECVPAADYWWINSRVVHSYYFLSDIIMTLYECRNRCCDTQWKWEMPCNSPSADLLERAQFNGKWGCFIVGMTDGVNQLRHYIGHNSHLHYEQMCRYFRMLLMLLGKEM